MFWAYLLYLIGVMLTYDVVRWVDRVQDDEPVTLAQAMVALTWPWHLLKFLWRTYTSIPQ